jgi:hypothetical protein
MTVLTSYVIELYLSDSSNDAVIMLTVFLAVIVNERVLRHILYKGMFLSDSSNDAVIVLAVLLAVIVNERV